MVVILMKDAASRKSRYANVIFPTRRELLPSHHLAAARASDARNLCRFYAGLVFLIGRCALSARVSFHRVARKHKQIVSSARERANGSSLHDNHSQRHVAECGGIAGPVLQLIADPVEVEPEHVGALAEIDPQLVDGQKLAAAKRADMRVGNALLVLDRPEWISLAHKPFGVGQQAGLDGSLLAAHPRKCA